MKQGAVLRIVLHKNNFTDANGEYNTHTITYQNLKILGYQNKPKTDPNHKGEYSTSPTYVDCKLTPEQSEYFLKKENSEELNIPQHNPKM